MKYKKSTVLPIALLAYLGVMSYIGFDYYRSGNYLFYFGIIGATLIVIFLLYLSLKRKERLKKEREDDIDNNQYKKY